MNTQLGEALGFAPVAALTPIIVVHGLVFSAWMLMLLVQTGLVARAKVRWHRRLGFFGGVLAGAMVVLGVGVQIASLRRDLASGGFEALPPFVRSAVFGGFASIAVFAVLMSAALYWRRHPEAHKRLVLLATIAVLGAATVRVARLVEMSVPAMGSFPFLGLVLTDVFLVALVANDVTRHKRLHPATV